MTKLALCWRVHESGQKSSEAWKGWRSDNESGPRTGKRKRAGNGESVLQPGPQGRGGGDSARRSGPKDGIRKPATFGGGLETGQGTQREKEGFKFNILCDALSDQN